MQTYYIDAWGFVHTTNPYTGQWYWPVFPSPHKVRRCWVNLCATLNRYHVKTTNIKSFEVVGSSRRCLVLDVDGRHVFCSTSNYAYLCMHPDAHWDIVRHAEHEGYRKSPRTHEPIPTYFPESYWIQVYKPTLF